MNSFELEDILWEYHVRVCCADELPDNIKERPRTLSTPIRVQNQDLIGPCFIFPRKDRASFSTRLEISLVLTILVSSSSTVLTTSALQIEFNRQTA